jgi:hypothetical protein
MKERSKAYQDYLDALRKPKLAVAITGETSVLPAMPLEFSASVTRPDGKPLPAGLRYHWIASTQAAKVNAEGLKGSASCELTGPITLTLEIYQTMGPGDERFLASQAHRFEVVYPKVGFALEGPENVKNGGSATFQVKAENPGALSPYLAVRWNVDGIVSRPGPEMNREVTFTQTGKHTVGASLMALISGREFPLGGQSLTVMVSGNKDDGKPDPGSPDTIAAGNTKPNPPTGSPVKPPGTTTSPPPADPASTTGGFDPRRLNLQLEIKAENTTVCMGDSVSLSASYSADNYIRERLRLVWDPDLGGSDYVRFQGTKPGTHKITLTALLPIKEVPTKVGEASVEITVLPPSSIKAPAEVNGTDIFDVSLEIPPELKGKVANITWSGGMFLDENLLPVESFTPTTKTKIKMQAPRDPSGSSATPDGKWVDYRIHAGRRRQKIGRGQG